MDVSLEPPTAFDDDFIHNYSSKPEAER